MRTKRIFSQEVLEDIEAQSFDVDAEPRPPVMAVSLDYPAGWVIKSHTHSKGQLVYCPRGILSVQTDQGIWVAPPNRAVWVPAGISHEITVNQAAQMRTVYIDGSLSTKFPTKPRAITVSPLLRELILRAVEEPVKTEPLGYRERLNQLLLDEIVILPDPGLSLPYPTDRRLTTLARAIEEKPNDRRTLKQWGKHIGLSDRSIERLFKKETGMSFHHWRVQVRILKSLTLLGERKSIKTISYDLGFKNPSAFILMFKKVMGVTPGEYSKDS